MKTPEIENKTAKPAYEKPQMIDLSVDQTEVGVVVLSEEGGFAAS